MILSKISPKFRKDFDYQCQCGFWVCQQCERPFYPMELDHEDRPDRCPECDGECLLYNLSDDQRKAVSLISCHRNALEEIRNVIQTRKALKDPISRKLTETEKWLESCVNYWKLQLETRKP